MIKRLDHLMARGGQHLKSVDSELRSEFCEIKLAAVAWKPVQHRDHLQETPPPDPIIGNYLVQNTQLYMWSTLFLMSSDSFSAW
jgi:hypothetical protein